jgi:ABC-2 type transport system permease protein
MTGLHAALWVEILKLRRSTVPAVTVVVFAVAAAVSGLFMFILQDPDRARAMGLLGTKAALATEAADWPSYFAMLSQTVAVGGLLIFGLVTVWSFGREFSDHTVNDLLALPTPRTAIVAAKFVVTSLWCLVLGVLVSLFGLGIGALLGLPGWSGATAAGGIGGVLVATLMTVLLTTPFGLAASIGRGYLAAVGVMFVVVFLSQIIAALGYGHLFPWSVPALFGGVAGESRTMPGPLGYGLVVLTGAAGAVATAVWWTTADQTR